MIEVPWQEGTPGVKRSGSGARVKVSADGKGVVSHAGAALLRELASETGLAGAVTGALLDTYRVPAASPGAGVRGPGGGDRRWGGCGDRDRAAPRPGGAVRAGRLDADGVAAAGPH